ncbi:MAG: type II toxin-antitoxin system VapC family toxin [Planctomycetota bacterium]
MPFAFDTDAVSELARRRPLPAFVAWLRGVPADDMALPALVRAELLAGAAKLPDPAGARLERHYRANVFPLFAAVLPFAQAAADVYATARADPDAAGQTMPDMDLLIAATAIASGHVLVTGNARHFARLVPYGLRLCSALSDARAHEG